MDQRLTNPDANLIETNMFVKVIDSGEKPNHCYLKTQPEREASAVRSDEPDMRSS
jgi:hypothetical protein